MLYILTINIDKIASKVLHLLLNNRIINLKNFVIMIDMFSPPQECFSKQDAIEAFKHHGVTGPVEIGIASNAEFDFFAWHSNGKGREAILPVFKFQATTTPLPVISFVPISEETSFAAGEYYYHIDRKGELKQIDILFNQTLATEIIGFFTDNEFYDVRLGLVAPNIPGFSYHDLCWIWQEDNVPHFQPVFREDNFLFNCRCRRNPNVVYNLLEPGDFIRRQDMLWQICQGPAGQEIFPSAVINPNVS